MLFYRIEDKYRHGPYINSGEHRIYKAHSFDNDLHSDDDHPTPMYDYTVPGTCGFASLLDLYRWFKQDVAYLNRYYRVSVYMFNRMEVNPGHHQATVDDCIFSYAKPVAHLSVKDAMRIARRAA